MRVWFSRQNSASENGKQWRRNATRRYLSDGALDDVYRRLHLGWHNSLWRHKDGKDAPQRACAARSKHRDGAAPGRPGEKSRSLSDRRVDRSNVRFRNLGRNGAGASTHNSAMSAYSLTAARKRTMREVRSTGLKDCSPKRSNANARNGSQPTVEASAGPRLLYQR